MANLLVVGSICLDSVETPFGKVEDVLGGSSLYFSTAASYFAPLRIVGVVGTDFPQAELDFLKNRNADVSGIDVLPGKTFRYGCRYHENMNIRDSLFTDLNVFADFDPELPAQYRDSDYLFLANIQPDLQLNVLEQVRAPKFVAMDTMNFWISGMLPELKKVLQRVDLLIINDQEVLELTGEHHLAAGAKAILSMGPKTLIIKKGQHGATLYTENGYFWAPSFPVSLVKDPTGAGDTFAGGFMGYLTMTDDLSEANMRRAILFGTAMASFAIEDFSVYPINNLTPAQINARFDKLLDIIHCEPGKML